MGEIKPALVTQAIQFGLAQGWNPQGARRSPFVITYKSHRFQAGSAKSFLSVGRT